jgi:hypothetical protein
MKTVKLSEVKRGEFFQLKTDGKFYQRADYDKSTKKYGFIDCDDVNNYRQKAGNVLVIIGATY